MAIKKSKRSKRELMEMTGSRKMAKAKSKKAMAEAFARMDAKKKKKKKKMPVTGILEGQGYVPTLKDADKYV